MGSLAGLQTRDAEHRALAGLSLGHRESITGRIECHAVHVRKLREAGRAACPSRCRTERSLSRREPPPPARPAGTGRPRGVPEKRISGPCQDRARSQRATEGTSRLTRARRKWPSRLKTAQQSGPTTASSSALEQEGVGVVEPQPAVRAAAEQLREVRGDGEECPFLQQLRRRSASPGGSLSVGSAGIVRIRFKSKRARQASASSRSSRSISGGRSSSRASRAASRSRSSASTRRPASPPCRLERASLRSAWNSCSASLPLGLVRRARASSASRTRRRTVDADRRGHQQDRHRRQRRGQRPVPLAPPPAPLPARHRPGRHRPAGQEPAQVVGQRRGRRVPAGRVLLQALQAHRLQVAGHLRAAAGPTGSGASWITRFRVVDRRVAAERRAAGEQFVQDRPERLHVGRRPDLVVPPGGLLRGHVRRRAEQVAGAGVPAVAGRSPSPARSRRPSAPRPP